MVEATENEIGSEFPWRTCSLLLEAGRRREEEKRAEIKNG